MLSSLLALSLLASPIQSIPQKPERPRDIWAFRSVLDGRARILTLALHKDLWVAYDATNCGLYRAWTGGVNFDGAVYTTVHGPQPTSMGTVHLLGLVDQPVWRLEQNGRAAAVQPEFKGYRFNDGGITLQYRLRLPGRTVWVYERPEVSSTASGVALRRDWSVQGLRPDERVALEMLLPGPAGTLPAPFKASGEVVVGGKPFTRGTLWLNPAGTWIQAVFPEAAEETVSAELNPGIGDEDQEPAAPRIPGVAMRLYWIGAALDRIPTMMIGQTPNVSRVSPSIDFRTYRDFGSDQPDQFYVQITGFLRADREGEYQFRLTSDDGSRFRIRDEKIVDHDGLHSPESKEGRFRLAAGEHPFELEYFESGGGELLRLEWKPPGAAFWEVVPTSALSTPEGEVRVTSPGKKTIFDPARRWRPGDGLPLAGVHPSFDLATVRPKDFSPRVGGMDFLPDGRLAICTWDADGAVYLLEGVQSRVPHEIRVKRIAAGLAEPLGLKVVDGQIYVLQKQELTRLTDLDGDEIIDEYYAVANGWGVTSNFHEFAFGLAYDKGHFYANLAVAIDPGGRSTRPQNPDRGKTVRISKDGAYSFVASGLRTPNGIGKGYRGGLFITDNQGDWLPSSKVLHLREGAFFGSYAVDPELTGRLKEDPPVVWLPQGEIGNSPSQTAPLNIGPYRDQMIHGDVTHGGVKRVFVEEIDGRLQGAVFRWTQGLEAGINRLVWGPDGALYVGGIGSTGNWGQEGKERFGLQRLSYNGRPVFEPLAVRAKTNGLEIELTKPLLATMGASPFDYTVTSWRYVPTEDYGGAKIDERIMPVRATVVSSDRRRVFLELPGMQPGRVVHIKMNRGLASADYGELWTTEAWYTLNRIPQGRAVRVPSPAPPNVVSQAEAREGFVSLFDGRTLAGWRGFRRDGAPAGWSAVDGELRLAPAAAGGGDLMTHEQFDNFELRLEWRIEPGGNSGIIYRSTEEQPASYLSGPEYQLLDDDLNPSGQNPLLSAGANYGVMPRTRDVARPAGAWNETRILVAGDHVEHWLNGFKVVEYRLNSPQWRKLVDASKFAAVAAYGQARKGHIVLQDHGNRVSFRNVRVRRIP